MQSTQQDGSRRPVVSGVLAVYKTECRGCRETSEAGTQVMQSIVTTFAWCSVGLRGQGAVVVLKAILQTYPIIGTYT